MTSTNIRPEKRPMNIFDYIFMSIIALFIGLVISIIIEYSGIFLGYWDIDHTRQMIVKEVNYLDVGSSNKLPFISTPMESGEAYLKFLNEHGFGFNEVFSYFVQAGFSDRVSTLITIPVGVISLYGMRLIICFYSLLMFVVLMLIALVEGLLSRELRILGGGKESAFIYHHLKKRLKPVFGMGWAIYLLSPISYHPNLILVPMGVLFALFFRGFVMYWKKVT